MLRGLTETYAPRRVSRLDVWSVGPLEFKAYGLIGGSHQISAEMKDQAQALLDHTVLHKVTAYGKDNGLGFVVVHPGVTGLSVAANWWTEGSVLCQHFHRHPYGADTPLDSAARPVIGCVWELAIVNAEQEIWRETMMSGVADPDAYLATWMAADAV